MGTGLVLGWHIGGNALSVILAIALAVFFSWSISWIFAFIG